MAMMYILNIGVYCVEKEQADNKPGTEKVICL